MNKRFSIVMKSKLKLKIIKSNQDIRNNLKLLQRMRNNRNNMKKTPHIKNNKMNSSNLMSYMNNPMKRNKIKQKKFQRKIIRKVTKDKHHICK